MKTGLSWSQEIKVSGLSNGISDGRWAMQLAAAHSHRLHAWLDWFASHRCSACRHARYKRRQSPFYARIREPVE